MRRVVRHAALLAALLASLPAAGQQMPQAEHAEASWLRAEDFRVARVAYRLATAGAPHCPDPHPVTGLMLHHLPEYDAAGRKIQIDRYQLDRGPGVLATVAGSPAARAGLIAGDTLLSVDGVPFPDPLAMAAEPDRDSWRRMIEASEGQLEAALRRGPARLRLLRDGREIELTLGSIAGCPARVRLARSSQPNAFAKRGYVVVTSEILGFVASDDELAIVVGHELAHNILDHHRRLQAQKVPTGLLRSFGKNAARVRATEEEADRLGLKLSWAAGYDPAAAIRFWQRYYAAHPDGLQIFRTHPSLKARERLVNEVVAELAS